VLDDLIAMFVSAWILVWTALYEPNRGGCPAGWHHEGIRKTGRYECVRAPVGSMDFDGTWGKPDRSYVPPGRVESRIYCTGGAQPIVVNERTVGCQRFW